MADKDDKFYTDSNKITGVSVVRKDSPRGKKALDEVDNAAAKYGNNSIRAEGYKSAVAANASSAAKADAEFFKHSETDNEKKSGRAKGN